MKKIYCMLLTVLLLLSLSTVVFADEKKEVLEEAMGNMTEIASVGNLVFYSYYNAESDNTEEYLAGIAPAYQEEFKVLKAAMQDVLKNGEYYAPVIPGADLVGKVYSFEGTDLEGNPIKSEDIFKDYDVIMVNLWTTWCHNCVGEMTALGEMAERFAEKNVAVVGICMDADDELDACKEILKEHNVNYLNLMPVKNLDEILDWDGAFPTSYFFGSDGTLLSPPFSGAPQTMEPYEKIINSLLEGKTVEMENPATSYIAANSEGVYRVIVSDSDGDKVKGATVQFCSDTACMFGKTDENGVVVFAAEEGPIYDVHILKVPEGYVKSTEEYLTGETYCDICIPLEKAE